MPAISWTPTTPVPSPREVDNGKTAKGGFTAKTLAGWGVPWPPPAGWQEQLRRSWALEHHAIDYSSTCPENVVSGEQRGHDWIDETPGSVRKTKLWICSHCGGLAVTGMGRKRR